MLGQPQFWSLLSYGAAFAAFAGALVLVLVSHPGTRPAHFLIAALTLSMVWSGIIVVAVMFEGTAVIWTPIIDSLHIASWLAFAAILLLNAEASVSARRIGTAIVALGGVILLLVLLAAFDQAGARNILRGEQLIFTGLLLLPLLGILAIEQVVRNAGFGERRVVIPLALGVGMVFLLDIAWSSQLFVFSEFNRPVWQLRGLGNALAAPLVLVAIKRHGDWEQELFLSRQMVFHTATLLAAGIYLLGLGLAASLVEPFDGTTRALLQLALFGVTAAAFLYAVASRNLRRRFKVFIAKHFFRNRYDYRHEWLRLIATLSGSSGQSSLTARGVKTLAEIVGSPRGELWWLSEPGGDYDGFGGWGMPVPEEPLRRNSALVRFLTDTHWVVDTDEYREDSELYANAFEADGGFSGPSAIYVPLIQGDDLRGVVRLDRPPELGRMSFEDHDLLKTAGKQVAVFLAQEHMQAKLSEVRQFDAFSRLTTFLMHDLKNLISQQELVVGNAQRFKHKPEFIDDAIQTIDASVRRMRKILERLQTHSGQETVSIIDVGKLLAEIVNECSDREPVPSLDLLVPDVFVRMNRDRLAMTLTHAIRNAQDATPNSGCVEIGCSVQDAWAVVSVADNGSGMDTGFVRDRLFRPFDSTKGAQGMGIGAYQIRETVRATGGSVDVESAVGEGTRLRLRLPLAVPQSGSDEAAGPSAGIAQRSRAV